MQARESGVFLWVGPEQEFGVGHARRAGRGTVAAPGLPTRLSEVIDVRVGPITEWHLERGELRFRGAPLTPADLARTRALLIDVKKEGPRAHPKALALERFISERHPGVAILHPMEAEPLFRTKIALFDLAQADPTLRDLVVPHQVIRSAEDIDVAIDRFSFPIVAKANDLAAGHGMRLVRSRKEFLAQVRAIRLHPLRYRMERLLQPLREAVRRRLDKGRWREHHYLNDGRVVANPFVETFRPEVGGRVQVSLNYLGPQLVMIRTLVYPNGWNMRTSDQKLQSIEQLGPERFAALAQAVLDAVERSRESLTALRGALPAWPIRLDAMLDTAGRIVVSEAEFTWGHARRPFHEGLLALGYDLAHVEARTGWNVHIDVRALARARSHMG
jgi:hypothetical protein